jgi:hypothetical protein
MEQIETLNQRLIDHYGMDLAGRPMFRIVWANNETEKRLMSTTDSGIMLLSPQVREVKKYPYLKNLYVLEHLVLIPEVNADELPASRMSYEPIWAYRDGKNAPLPPVWGPTKFLIDVMLAAVGKRNLAKYVDDEKNTTPEGRDQRIAELQQELFGNDTETSDAIRYKEGIVVPNNYTRGE